MDLRNCLLVKKLPSATLKTCAKSKEVLSFVHCQFTYISILPRSLRKTLKLEVFLQENGKYELNGGTGFLRELIMCFSLV